MNLDPARARLLELVAENQTDLAAVSKAIGRNHAYLHQFVKKGKPRNLRDDMREALARHFGVSPDEFRSGGQAVHAADTRQELIGLYEQVPPKKRGDVLAAFRSITRLAITSDPATPAAPVQSSRRFPKRGQR